MIRNVRQIPLALSYHIVRKRSWLSEPPYVLLTDLAAIQVLQVAMNIKWIPSAETLYCQFCICMLLQLLQSRTKIILSTSFLLFHQEKVSILELSYWKVSPLELPEWFLLRVKSFVNLHQKGARSQRFITVQQKLLSADSRVSPQNCVRAQILLYVKCVFSKFMTR